MTPILRGSAASPWSSIPHYLLGFSAGSASHVRYKSTAAREFPDDQKVSKEDTPGDDTADAATSEKPNPSPCWEWQIPDLPPADPSEPQVLASSHFIVNAQGERVDPFVDAALPNPPTLTHVTSSGEAHMVDVSLKPPTHRTAIAHACVIFSVPDPARLIAEDSNKKGDVLGVARIAGIMAAKRCADIIPLCHPIALSKVGVELKLYAPGKALPPLCADRKNVHGVVYIEAKVQCLGPTGVEMEALTAVSGAALTVFDMCKAVDKGMCIDRIGVALKEGGKSGRWVSPLWRER